MDLRARSLSVGDECPRTFCSGRRTAWFGEARGVRRGRRLGCRAVHSSILEQSLMATASELLSFAAFAELPEDQIAWFLSQSQEINLKAGTIYARQGDPPEAMFVLLEGEFEWRGEFNGETVVFPGKIGDVTGALPFSRMTRYTVSGRAIRDG